MQLNCYAEHDRAVLRHIAFRDYLRCQPEPAVQYQHEKMRCVPLHSNNTHAYTRSRSLLIKQLGADALQALRTGASRNPKERMAQSASLIPP
jgi:GrpB-like predicted nucleotidyltransferase (UPF0157 family)